MQGRRNSETWIEQEEKETEISVLGTARLYTTAAQPEPPSTLPQAGEEERGRTKSVGPSLKIEGPLSLLAKELGVLQYSLAARGYLDNG